MPLVGRFTYNADLHIYHVGPWRVPGTSEIMKAAGLVDLKWFTPAGRVRGSLIHDLTYRLDLGLVKLEQIETDVRGWVLAYARFVDDYGFRHHVTPSRFDLLEQCVVSRDLGFATIIDRAGRLHGPMTLNIKTGAAPSPQHRGLDAHAIVRAGEVLAQYGYRAPVKRYTLYLRKTGTYDLREHKNERDFYEFLNALQTWRRECHQPQRHGPLHLLRTLDNKRSFLLHRRPCSPNIVDGSRASASSRPSRKA